MSDHSSHRQSSHTYSLIKPTGNGAFGMVYKAKDNQNGKVVAIKKVFQDLRYKNREFPNLHKNKSSININNKNYYSQKNNKSKMIDNLPKIDIKNNKTKNLKDSNYLKKDYLFDINDKEDENIKEITNLMKKMINE